MENKNKLNSDSKKKICKAVQKHRIIWDKTEKPHSNRNALRKAWERVSNEVGVNEQLCRRGWKSVNDSQRYHKSKAKPSGSACNLDMDIEYLSEQEDVVFLVEPSLKRTTDSTNIFECLDDTSLQPSTSSYSNKEKPASMSKADYLSGLAETGTQLAQSKCSGDGRERAKHPLWIFKPFKRFDGWTFKQFSAAVPIEHH